MKICFICGEYPPDPHGGIGTVTRLLAHGLAGRGHDVRVIGIVGQASTAPAFTVDGGVHVWRLREPGVPGGWILARRRLFTIVSAWARTREIDVVELPDWQGWAAGWPAIGVPVITRLHGSATYFAAEMGRRARRLTRLLERQSLVRTDYWCSTSRYTAERTQKLFALRSRPAAIMPNPIDLPSESGHVQRSDWTVLFSGTLTAKKGIVPLIDAWPLVRGQCPSAHLNIFGRDGTTARNTSMRAFLEARLPSVLRPTVTFHGYTERPVLLHQLRRARVAVFPSFAEVCAMAPLEAMACGCPTISSARGSGPELFDHERHGLLVDPGNPAAIAAAIVRLLRDEDLASRLAAAGREHVVERFGLAGRLNDNLDFYSDCLHRFAGGRRASPRPVAIGA